MWKDKILANSYGPRTVGIRFSGLSLILATFRLVGFRCMTSSARVSYMAHMTRVSGPLRLMALVQHAHNKSAAAGITMAPSTSTAPPQAGVQHAYAIPSASVPHGIFSTSDCLQSLTRFADPARLGVSYDISNSRTIIPNLNGGDFSQNMNANSLSSWSIESMTAQMTQGNVDMLPPPDAFRLLSQISAACTCIQIYPARSFSQDRRTRSRFSAKFRRILAPRPLPYWFV